MTYPVVLSDFTFQGEHFQVWNQEERLWVVMEKTPPNDAMGTEWELVSLPLL